MTGFDVARLAGVGQPTVSRALRGLPGVSPSTRAKVQQAAEQLGYLPSDTARALSTRVTRRVAVVSEEMDNPYYAQLLGPLRRSLAQHGYRMVLLGDFLQEGPVADALCDGSYDGVILTTTKRASSLPSELRRRGLPHVLANRVLDDRLSPSVAIDNHAGASAAARLLLELGHVRVAVIAGPVDTSTGRERLTASLRALTAGGVSVPRAFQPRVPFTHDAAREAALVLLQTRNRPTAVLCGNDVQAFGVLSAARELGLTVPRDLSVIGFDDIPMAGWPVMNLTTVHCDLDELASCAVQVLREVVVEGQPPHESDVRRVAPRLVTRATHAPAP